MMLKLLSLETSLNAVVPDLRITMVLTLIRTSVIVYIFVRAILLWTVIEYEDVVASYNSWGYTAWKTHNVFQNNSQAVEPMCNGDPTFDFAPRNPLFSGGVYAVNFSCPLYQMGEVFQQVGEELQLRVAEQRHFRTKPGCENGVPQGNSAEFAAAYAKACTKSHYIRNIEELPIFLLHTVAARDTGIVEDSMECSIVNSAGEELALTNNPMGKGPWSFTLAQLLKYAGASNSGKGKTLDDDNDNEFDMLSGSPRLRFTGFILTVRFLYWNYAPIGGELGQYFGYKRFPFDWQPSKPRCEVRVELEKKAWGFLGGTQDGNDLVFKHAARVKVLGRGKFGRISLRLIITNIVEAIVLIGLARVITRFIATRFYGYGSELTSEVLRSRWSMRSSLSLRSSSAADGIDEVDEAGETKSDHRHGTHIEPYKTDPATPGSTSLHMKNEHNEQHRRDSIDQDSSQRTSILGGDLASEQLNQVDRARRIPDEIMEAVQVAVPQYFRGLDLVALHNLLDAVPFAEERLSKLETSSQNLRAHVESLNKDMQAAMRSSAQTAAQISPAVKDEGNSVIQARVESLASEVAHVKGLLHRLQEEQHNEGDRRAELVSQALFRAVSERHFFRAVLDMEHNTDATQYVRKLDLEAMTRQLKLDIDQRFNEIASEFQRASSMKHSDIHIPLSIDSAMPSRIASEVSEHAWEDEFVPSTLSRIIDDGFTGQPNGAYFKAPSPVATLDGRVALTSLTAPSLQGAPPDSQAASSQTLADPPSPVATSDRQHFERAALTPQLTANPKATITI